MKSIRALFTAVLLTCVLGFSSAFAQGFGDATPKQLLVANATGFTIMQLGLIDSDAKGEAKDLLGEDTLSSGEVLQITYSGSPKGWELIAVDGEGGQVNWENLDLTGVKKITLHADGTAKME